MLLVVLLAAGFHLQSRFDEIDQEQSQHRQVLAETLRLRLLEHAGEAPAELLQDTLDNEDLRAWGLIDAQGHTLFYAGLHPPRHLLPGSALPMPGNETLRLVGQLPSYARPVWLWLQFSDDGARLRKDETLLAALLLTLAALGLSSIFVVASTRQLLRPIRGIIETAGKLRGAQWDTRFPEQGSREFNLLGQHLNQMLSTLQSEVDDLKQSMEQTHEDLQSTLESMEIKNIELSLARKEALEANRIKSEFLANMSHEIRTPLNGIMGFANLLARSRLSPRQHDYVQTIQKSSENLLAIINDVLDLSKIEADKLILERIPLNIEECVHDVQNLLAPLAAAKHLQQITFVYQDVPRHLMGDPLRIKQILINLLSNAIKFTPQGEITLRVMLEQEDEQEPTLRLSVTDTGIGVSADESLFQPFSQGGLQSQYGGTGLGLVISKRLVEMMGGEISYESAPGQGSTFWFTLRLRRDPLLHESAEPALFASCALIIGHDGLRQMWEHLLARWCGKIHTLRHEEELDFSDHKPELVVAHVKLQEADSLMARTRQQGLPLLLLHDSADPGLDRLHDLEGIETLALPASAQKLWSSLQHLLPPSTLSAFAVMPSPLPTGKVLVVDDHPANLLLVSTLLEDLGLTVLHADSGAAALACVEKEKVDMILMDIRMPGMDGLTATRAIRALHTHPRMPIIAVTAHAMASERQEALAAGMDDYMTKPLQEAQLRRLILRWLQPGQRALDGHAQHAPVDWEEGRRLAAGKKDLAEEMITMLVTGLPAEIEALHQALARGDREQLLDRVHYLHGACRYCGVPRLRSLASDLDQRLREGGDDDATLNAEVASLLSAMQELVDWWQARPSPR